MDLTHNVIIENRARMSLSGVTDVENFDENEISLYTSMGDMVIRGKNLHVESVSIESGEMSISGEIKSLVWGDKDRTKKPTLWQKMTR
ncbi:MAG: sporulation protein YabP [Oscillospiraceae bacterium]|nr:sporulation protein YabP [Oscillospiraceae bacterium]